MEQAKIACPSTKISAFAKTIRQYSSVKAKTLCQSPFFERRCKAPDRRVGRKEKKEMLNPSVLDYNLVFIQP
jgi:hypothetical protein